MFNDPQSMTLGGGSKSLARIGVSNPERLGKFRTADGAYEVQIRQNQTSKRFRREAVVTFIKNATDPFTAEITQQSASLIVAFDEPKVVSFTDAELIDCFTGLSAWLTATTNANALKLLGGES